MDFPGSSRRFSRYLGDLYLLPEINCEAQTVTTRMVTLAILPRPKGTPAWILRRDRTQVVE